MTILRQPEAKDVSLINQWQQDSFIVTWFNSGSPMRQIDSIDGYLPHGTDEHFIIEHDGQPVGLIYAEEDIPQTTSVVYFIGEESLRRHGIGKAAMQELIRLANQRGWQTINAGVCELNYPSWKMLIDAGFKILGKRKADTKYMALPGQYFDTLRLSHATQFSPTEEQVHQLMIKALFENKTELLKKYQQVNQSLSLQK